jgi:ubiquinone/menaquinone biosynthesis C-methylase UbiE
MTTTTTAAFQANPVRSPFNAVFFTVMGGYLDWLMRSRKQRVFADVPEEVVELGPGVGANFRYLRPGTRVTAVEPNPAMHGRLRARAARHGIELDLHGVIGEQIDLPDESTDMIVSSLVLCTVKDPAQVLSEVQRVLRPGGRYAFVEHVVAKERPVIRFTQRLVRRPWAWTFEGCSCERDLAHVIAGAGFSSVDLEEYQIHSPILPFNTHVAGIATKGR